MESRISDYHLSSHLENDLSMTCPSEKHCPVDSFCREESNSESVSGGSSDGSVSISMTCPSEKHCPVDNFCREESNSESASGGSSDGSVSIIEGLSIEDHTQPMSIDVSTNSSSSDEDGCPKCSNDTLLCNRNDDSGYLMDTPCEHNLLLVESTQSFKRNNASNEEGCLMSPKKAANCSEFYFNSGSLNQDQVAESPETDVINHDYKTFEQHPDFSQFVDMESLTLGDLPEIYRHNEMLDLIRAEASVVVKIQLGDNIPGSGLADDVWFSYDEGFCPCSCDSCVVSQDKEWGIITIVTSSKLMYGSTENIPHLTCTFFYDSEDRKEVKQLQAHKLQSFNERSDMMMFSCLTSDMVFLNKVMANLHTFSDCWETAFDKYYSTVKWEQEKIAFVVSHPYGLRKHLAIGHQLSSQDDDEVEKPKIAYDIPSCPGCIGAYVLLPYFDMEDDWFNII